MHQDYPQKLVAHLPEKNSNFPCIMCIYPFWSKLPKGPTHTIPFKKLELLELDTHRSTTGKSLSLGQLPNFLTMICRMRKSSYRFVQRIDSHSMKANKKILANHCLDNSFRSLLYQTLCGYNLPLSPINPLIKIYCIGGSR